MPQTPKTAGSQLQNSSRLGLSAHLAMWLIVLTLVLIAVPKHWLQVLHLLPMPQATVPYPPSVPLAAPPSAIPTSTPATIASGAATAVASHPDSDLLKPVADIAKMTLDASKDKYDSIKDAYDKLFSVLVAMAALLAFLGFKGLESFVDARTKAEESTALAATATVSAERASKIASDANIKLERFLNVTNELKNRAELNVSNGIALRETARVYADCWELINPQKTLADMPSAAFKKYTEYLDMSEYYLGIALKEQEPLDERVILRAMGTLCNVRRALNRVSEALQLAEQIISTYGTKDDSAHFNAACYCSLLAHDFTRAGMVSQGNQYAVKALAYLKAAVALDDDNRGHAREDGDFAGVKHLRAAEFHAIIDIPQVG